MGDINDNPPNLTLLCLLGSQSTWPHLEHNHYMQKNLQVMQKTSSWGWWGTAQPASKNGAKLPALIAALDILHLSVMLVMKGIQLLENMGLRHFFVDKTRNDMASIPAAGKQQGWTSVSSACEWNNWECLCRLSRQTCTQPLRLYAKGRKRRKL